MIVRLVDDVNSSDRKWISKFITGKYIVELLIFMLKKLQHGDEIKKTEI